MSQRCIKTSNKPTNFMAQSGNPDYWASLNFKKKPSATFTKSQNYLERNSQRNSKTEESKSTMNVSDIKKQISHHRFPSINQAMKRENKRGTQINIMRRITWPSECAWLPDVMAARVTPPFHRFTTQTGFMWTLGESTGGDVCPVNILTRPMDELDDIDELSCVNIIVINIGRYKQKLVILEKKTT